MLGEVVVVVVVAVAIDPVPAATNPDEDEADPFKVTFCEIDDDKDDEEDRLEGPRATG